jgi:hypothetical protein
MACSIADQWQDFVWCKALFVEIGGGCTTIFFYFSQIPPWWENPPSDDTSERRVSILARSVSVT